MCFKKEECKGRGGREERKRNGRDGKCIYLYLILMCVCLQRARVRACVDMCGCGRAGVDVCVRACVRSWMSERIYARDKKSERIEGV